jgi:hypothetical protein
MDHRPFVPFCADETEVVVALRYVSACVPSPGQIELDRDPTASERALGPAARSSAVQNLAPLSIKFGLSTAEPFIEP